MTQELRGAVEFRAVRKAFGSFTAIPDLSLTIAPGELVTLLGPSGCGKTTTLRMLAGLESPTAGTILIGGQDVTRLPANRRDVSMVFQSYALFPHMTVGQNVAYGLESGGMKPAEAREAAGRGLDLVGLAGLGARLPAELSGGQQQRVAVARALVLEPQVLLLDEPLSNLDARLRRRVRTEIRELQQRLGFTAVYVTHDQEEALAVSDRIVVMREGRVEQQGTPRELYDSPASAFIADFIGEANVLDCRILSVEAGVAQVQLGTATLPLPARDLAPGPARLALRSNAVSVATGAAGALAGRVMSSAYLGDHIEYEIEGAFGHIFAVDSESDRPPAARDRGLARPARPRRRTASLKEPPMPIADTLEARLTLATDLARQAGALALDYFHQRDALVIETKRHVTDLVSKADREVETLIRDALTAAFPEDAQLGEEHGLSPGRSGLTWVIDPIDGTAPYLAGLPGWCVSIGACDHRGPVLGVLLAPVLGELFVAGRGMGASLNGAPIRAAAGDLRSGLLGVGANDRVGSDQVGAMLAALMAAGSGWVRYGSGALMLAWVAAGRLVGYAEPRMSAWDCMAGYSLILEAGGRVLDFPSGAAMAQPAPVLGAGPAAYDEILRLCRLDDRAIWERR